MITLIMDLNDILFFLIMQYPNWLFSGIFNSTGRQGAGNKEREREERSMGQLMNDGVISEIKTLSSDRSSADCLFGPHRWCKAPVAEEKYVERSNFDDADGLLLQGKVEDVPRLQLQEQSTENWLRKVVAANPLPCKFALYLDWPNL